MANTAQSPAPQATQAEVGHDAGGHASFPPFESSTFPSQLLWLVITFGALYYFMSKRLLPQVGAVIESRKPANGGDPEKSYVARLFTKGDDAILKKIGEEATETVMAAKDARVDGKTDKVLYECADLWFHSMVLLAQFDLTPQQVLDELARREGISGIEEKASRK